MHHWPKKLINHGARRKWPLALSISRRHPNPAHRPNPTPWANAPTTASTIISPQFAQFSTPNTPSIAFALSIAVVPYIAFVLPSRLPRSRVAIAPLIAVTLALSIAVNDIACCHCPCRHRRHCCRHRHCRCHRHCRHRCRCRGRDRRRGHRHCRPKHFLILTYTWYA